MAKRLSKLKYTLRHRCAFRKTEKHLLGKNTLSGWLHDIDKVFLYPILGARLTSAFHRKLSAHHVPRCMKKEKWIVQAIIDWECARCTKPDKPLNARKTLLKYYSSYFEEVNPVLLKMGL